MTDRILIITIFAGAIGIKNFEKEVKIIAPDNHPNTPAPAITRIRNRKKSFFLTI
jgi:hypothetical protein